MTPTGDPSVVCPRNPQANNDITMTSHNVVHVHAGRYTLSVLWMVAEALLVTLCNLPSSFVALFSRALLLSSSSSKLVTRSLRNCRS